MSKNIDKIAKPYLEFVRPYYGTRDQAHDIRHIERILSRLEMLCEDLPEEPDLDVLCFLACFHGLWPLIRDDDLFRKETAVFLAKRLGWDDMEISQVFKHLERHLRAPKTIEEQIIFDANYVELLGTFGIAKAFTIGGGFGHTYEQTVDIYEHQYLDKIEFRTPVGKRLAEEGRAYVKGFLDQLKSEL